MDVIFCQNLLIYFRCWRRREILNHLAERLVPGGLLVVGVGEVAGFFRTIYLLSHEGLASIYRLFMTLFLRLSKMEENPMTWGKQLKMNSLMKRPNKYFELMLILL